MSAAGRSRRCTGSRPAPLFERAFVSDRPAQLFTEQHGAIIGGAVQKMDDDHLRRFDAIEDQIVAMDAPADTMVLVAGDEGVAIRIIDEILALAA